MKQKLLLILLVLFTVFSCNEEKSRNVEKKFDIEDVKPIIIQNSKLWNKGLNAKDLSIFIDLYDKKGHYLPDSDNSIRGNQAIAEYWKNSWDFVKDLHLKMETLEGNEDLLYETGTGTIKIMNNTGEYENFKYKYVNVWKKQDDGTYKVVIDIFNDIKK